MAPPIFRGMHQVVFPRNVRTLAGKAIFPFSIFEVAFLGEFRETFVKKQLPGNPGNYNNYNIIMETQNATGQFNNKSSHQLSARSAAAAKDTTKRRRKRESQNALRKTAT